MMGKGKGGTDDAKYQCMCDGGGREKNTKASLRLPITTEVHLLMTSPSEKPYRYWKDSGHLKTMSVPKA